VTDRTQIPFYLPRHNLSLRTLLKMKVENEFLYS
jgi:hypothetical protein